MRGVEANPQLGWRAIRFCLDQPEIFKTQLRAILRASKYKNLQIMFPLISGVDQFRRVRSILDEVRAELKKKNVPFNPDLKIGTMIELPAAVEVADQLAQECDFFSIGTNDLVQYTLAVDRVNERIAHLYQPAHPAVLRMIRRTVKAAKAAGIPCTLCGEMAGDPKFAELLLGLDLDAISMSPLALPRVAVELGNMEYSKAKRFANKALKMHSAVEIEATIEKRFEQRRTMENLLKSFEERDERRPPDA
jgi:phosphotransferase system enzyme I (PtsI)